MNIASAQVGNASDGSLTKTGSFKIIVSLKPDFFDKFKSEIIEKFPDTARMAIEEINNFIHHFVDKNFDTILEWKSVFVPDNESTSV